MVKSGGQAARKTPWGVRTRVSDAGRRRVGGGGAARPPTHLRCGARARRQLRRPRRRAPAPRRPRAAPLPRPLRQQTPARAQRTAASPPGAPQGAPRRAARAASRAGEGNPSQKARPRRGARPTHTARDHPRAEQGAMRRPRRSTTRSAASRAREGASIARARATPRGSEVWLASYCGAAVQCARGANKGGWGGREEGGRQASLTALCLARRWARRRGWRGALASACRGWRG